MFLLFIGLVDEAGYVEQALRAEVEAFAAAFVEGEPECA